MGALSKLSTQCSKCRYKDTCENKEMEHLAYISDADAVLNTSQSISMPNSALEAGLPNSMSEAGLPNSVALSSLALNGVIRVTASNGVHIAEEIYKQVKEHRNAGTK